MPWCAVLCCAMPADLWIVPGVSSSVRGDGCGSLSRSVAPTQPVWTLVARAAACRRDKEAPGPLLLCGKSSAWELPAESAGPCRL